MLLSVTAVIKGTPVRALVDSGATRSFIDEKLQLRPPLSFIGAYSSLEMANGDTIVSTGIAPGVLVCIGSVQFRSDLTAVPLMKGYDIVLGKDWLDMVNPLIDWRSNCMYIRQGDQLHIVSGDPNVQPCGIKDRGLPGLRNSLSSTEKSETTDLQFGRWGELFAQLASPQFWEYQASQRQWTDAQPQGEVHSEDPVQNETQLDTGASKAKMTSQKQTRCIRVAGRVVRQPIREKLDFISLRQAKRLANSSDTPMYLGIIRGIEDFDMQLKQTKTKTKTKRSRPKLATAHGMTEGEKRRLMKETGPVTTEIPAETVIETHLQKADPAVRAPLRGIFDDYRDLFPSKLPYGPPPKRQLDHEIHLVPGEEPPYKSPYRLSSTEMEELRRQIEVLLEQGWIRPSSSPFGAPVLFVPKKGGQWHMCIDYRALNKITVKNRYPLPKVEELMDRLHGARYFTKLDLYSGYHQIRLREEDIQKTAFVTRYGAFEYLVMPFGLCNAPATFQRVMNTILRDGLDRFVLVFLDDILIFSRTREEHEQHIRAVLDRLRSEKFFCRVKKCEFYQTEVEYLGFDVGAHGVKPSIAKVKAVAEWPTPESVKDVRSFLGLASFYRKFIHRFSEIATPLTNLTKKGRAEVWSPDVWTDTEETAFR